jgi:hypothetical protein
MNTPELFDTLLLTEHISIAHHTAATMFGADLAESASECEALQSMSDCDEVNTRTFIRLFTDIESVIEEGGTVESLVDAIFYPLDRVQEYYGIADTPDPRDLIRRQIRIGH